MRGIALRALVALFLVFTLLPGVVLADNTSPDAAVQLTPAQPSASATLTGGGPEAFRYYRLDHPGGDASVTVHLTWDPGWWLTDAAVGFNIYGPDGLAGQGQRGDDSGSASTAEFTLVTLRPGSYLVQVYSYTPGTTSAFTLDVKGLGNPSVAVADNHSAEQAVAVADPAFLATGTLMGHGAGSFSYFTVDYPGGETVLRISLTVSPANWLFTEGYGVDVYESGTLVAHASEVSRDADVAVKTIAYERAAPGHFTVQVYNYAEGVNAEYELGISGGVRQIVPAVGNSSPGTALLLTPTANAARGTIVGDGGGAFAFFVIDYQGLYEPVTLVLSSRPGIDLTGQGVGEMLYLGDQQVGNSQVWTGATVDTGLALYTLQSDVGGRYLVQVYNYIPNLTADYELYVIGLR